MNYYSHHIGDYRRDTAHLSLLEHGVYRQLLDMYYLSEEKIPEETEVVYRRLCARTEDEKTAVNTVLFEFFKRENGWVHTRCEREISAYQGKADRARKNGKLGGRPSKTKVVISGNLEETEEKANHKPITNNHKPLTNINTNSDQAESMQDNGNKLPISKKKSNVTLKTFLEECQQKQERPLANYQGLTEYCKKVNLDIELVGLAWAVFKDRFLNITPNKKYSDWRAAFLNYVKNDYLRLWYLDKDGNRQLTQAGQQAKQEHGA